MSAEGTITTQNAIIDEVKLNLNTDLNILEFKIRFDYGNCVQNCYVNINLMRVVLEWLLREARRFINVNDYSKAVKEVELLDVVGMPVVVELKNESIVAMTNYFSEDRIELITSKI